MSIELECPDPGCKGGPGCSKWKSPPLPYVQADKQLDKHLLYNHQPRAPPNVPDGGGGQSRFEKMKHPTIYAGLSLKDWKFFLQEWERKSDGLDPNTSELLTNY